MFAEQDARTLPDPSDPPGTVGRRATVGNQAPTQRVLNKIQEVKLCVCLSLVFSALWGAPSRLAWNLRAEPLPHVSTYMHGQDSQEVHVHRDTPIPEPCGATWALPLDRPKSSLCLFFLEDGKL